MAKTKKKEKETNEPTPAERRKAMLAPFEPDDVASYSIEVIEDCPHDKAEDSLCEGEVVEVRFPLGTDADEKLRVQGDLERVHVINTGSEVIYHLKDI